jgi:hypothetical protein
MSKDGLLPKKFAKIHPKFKTPGFSTIVTGFVVGIPALFMDLMNEEMLKMNPKTAGIQPVTPKEIQKEKDNILKLNEKVEKFNQDVDDLRLRTERLSAHLNQWLAKHEIS